MQGANGMPLATLMGLAYLFRPSNSRTWSPRLPKQVNFIDRLWRHLSPHQTSLKSKPDKTAHARYSNWSPNTSSVKLIWARGKVTLSISLKMRMSSSCLSMIYKMTAHLISWPSTSSRNCCKSFTQRATRSYKRSWTSTSMDRSSPNQSRWKTHCSTWWALLAKCKRNTRLSWKRDSMSTLYCSLSRETSGVIQSRVQFSEDASCWYWHTGSKSYPSLSSLNCSTLH